MSVKDELRAAVDELSEHEAQEVLTVVRRLRAIAAWDSAPADDEEVTPEEQAAVAEAKAEIGAGQGVPWNRVKRGRTD